MIISMLLLTPSSQLRGFKQKKQGAQLDQIVYFNLLICLMNIQLIQICQNMKGIAILSSLFLLIVLAQSFGNDDSSRLLQSSTRTATVGKLCASFSSRATIVDDKAKADADTNKNTMKSSFKVDGNTLFSAAISDPNGIGSGLTTQLPNIQVDFGLFVAPFLLGLLVTFVIWPFLCCCCCCPSCCPSKCCQKPESEQYTKCELIWPSITLILALLLMIVASVIGITRATDIQSSYTSVGCSVAVTFDDVINGNTSTAGTFFIGMNGLKNSLTNLKNNIGTVQTELQKLDITNTAGVTQPAYTEGNSLLDTLSKIPDNTIGGTMTAYTYPTFDGSGGTISSNFPTILGSASTSTPSGAMNASYFAINKINQGFSNISSQATDFTGNIGSVGTTIDSIVGSMSDMVTTVSGIDDTISTMDDSVSPIMKIVTIVVTAIFGVFIGLGVLSIIGTILMTFCDKFSCRYLVYFVCVILVVLGILSFLLATLFSVITPVLYLGCDFLTTSISSQSSFTTNLGPLVPAQLSSYLSVCLPGGTGDLLNQIQGVNLTAINGLTDAVNSLRAFDVSLLQNGVQTSLNTLESFIDQYYYTDLYDFTATSGTGDKNFMAKIANPANYAGCSVNSFSSDSWVPSTRQTDIACSTTASYASSGQCTSSADIVAGRSTSTSCFGCIDSMKVLLVTTTPNADINARYTTAGACGTWATDMNNLWNNYYDVKKTNYAPIRTRMANTKAQYNTPTTGYHARISSVGTSFTNIINTLETVVSSVVDPNSGMIAGLNCLLLGEDMNLLANATCTKFFNTFYFLRLTLGISAFGILFSLCCATCSGVRAFKHSSRRGSVLPKDSLDPGESTLANLNYKA